MHPLVKTNWLASPPLVVATPWPAACGSTSARNRWAPAGRPRGLPEGHLAELEGKSPRRSRRSTPRCSTRSTPRSSPATRNGRRSGAAVGHLRWRADSTYIQHPPFFEHIAEAPPTIADVEQARVRWRCWATR
ncbi:hypothetical protein ACPA9J_07115 [Pseudomonas aeruginosa]